MTKIIGVVGYLSAVVAETTSAIIDKNFGTAVLLALIGMLVTMMIYHVTRVEHPKPDKIVYKDTFAATQKGTDDKISKLDTSVEKLHAKIDKLIDKLLAK